MRRVPSALLALSILALSSRAAALETVRVLVPDKGNLQYTSFWLADGAGYFGDEGYAVEMVAPPAPPQAESWFEERKADVAILPPPVYASLISHAVPVVLVANLLANDPINLVVRRSVMEERKLSAAMPLQAKLEGLRGVKLGIAPHPPARLKVLYASVGLDATKDVEQVVLHGKEQNEAFRTGKVDALYAHTPFVERALVHDDAVLLVNQSGGEAPALAHRQIHALAVRKDFLALHEPTARALVRAIARAEDLIHHDTARAATILKRMFPERDAAELDLIVKLYEPAIPATPAVRADMIPNAVELFPAEKPKPDLSKVDLGQHVADLSPPPVATTRGVRSITLAVLAILAVAALAYTRLRKRTST